MFLNTIGSADIENPEQPSLKESLDNTLEIIAGDPGLRALLSLVPYVGSSLVELSAGKGQQIIEERRNEFLQLLAERLERVEEQTVRKDFFETPEGFDLLVKALDENRKTRSRDKRELYARILTGAATASPDSKSSSAEEYLHIVSDLTLKELEIVRKMYDLQESYIKRYIDQEGQDPRKKYTGEETEIWRMQRETITKNLKIDNDELTQLVNRIASTGLISIRYINVPGSTVPTYWISPVFERLMEFIRPTE